MLLLMNILGEGTGIEAEFEGGGDISLVCEADYSYLLSLVNIVSIFWIKSYGIGRNLFSTILG